MGVNSICRFITLVPFRMVWNFCSLMIRTTIYLPRLSVIAVTMGSMGSVYDCSLSSWMVKKIRQESGHPGSSATTCGWAGRRSVATEVPAGTNVGCGIDPMRRSSLHHDLASRMFYDLNPQIKRIYHASSVLTVIYKLSVISSSPGDRERV